MNSKRSAEEEAARSSGGILNKRQKMTKASRKSDVMVGEEEEDVLTSIVPLRLAVLGGYLPLKDTGRFLLRVGKDMTASIFEERLPLGDAASAVVGGTSGAKDATVPRDRSEAIDTEANTISLRQGMARNEAWKFLCEQKWGNPSTLEHLVSIVGAGETTPVWEQLFRKFLPSPPKPPVRASVEDYSFVFALKKCDESERDLFIPLTTFVLKGDDAVKFLKTGESGWLELDSPVMLPRRLLQGQNWSHPMISTLHALRKSDGKSCELNFRADLDIYSFAKDKIYYNFSSGDVIGFSDLETIMTSSNMADDRGMSIDRRLRLTASKESSGSTEWKITHIAITATLFDADGSGDEFSDPSNELASGVTVADFISRLDVEWK